MCATKTINETLAYKWLKDKCGTGSAKNSYLGKIEEAATFLETELAKTVVHFKSYTNHDLGHSLSVLDYMWKLIKVHDDMTEEECMLIIFSALFHDIGMAKDASYDSIVRKKPIYKTIYDKSTLGNGAAKEAYAISESIRVKHGELAEERIKELPSLKDANGIPVKVNTMSFSDIFTLTSTDGKINGFSLVELLASICRSHQESVAWIQGKLAQTINIPGNQQISPQYVAYLLRIADLLDIDCKRAPLYYEWVNNVDAEGHNHYLKNQIFSTNEKIISCDDKSCTNADCVVKLSGSGCPKNIPTILFEGNYGTGTTDEDHEIRCKVYEYQDYLESEIRQVNTACSVFNSNEATKKYALKICEYINNRIVSTGVDVPNVLPHIHLGVDYDVIRSLFLEEKLYTDKMAGLRELIQNCYDACNALRSKLSDEIYGPSAIVTWDESNNILKVRDNGIGMSRLEIVEYFLNIGKSKYNFNSDYLYEGFHKDHIGHYGIGFFAAFMLSEEVKIITRNIDGNLKYTVNLKKNKNYAFIKEEQDTFFQGTTIELSLDKAKSVFPSSDILKQYIEKNFLDDDITILFSKNGESQKLKLKKLSEQNTSHADEYCIDISQYLDKVNALIYYRKRNNSVSNIRNFIFDGSIISEINIADLLKRIKGKTKICYINFPQVNSLLNIFIDINGSSEIDNSLYPLSRRLDYSLDRDIMPSLIPIKLFKFCDDNAIITRPDYADVIELHVEVNGDNVVIIKDRCVVSRIASTQLANDSCGTQYFNGSIFIRNVLIPDFKLVLPFVDEEYEPVALYANICTDNVFPTLDRRSVDNETATEFAYAIGQAFSSALKHVDMNKAYKQDLIIERLYNKKNRFIKTSN